jgi:hypothetical protein
VTGSTEPMPTGSLRGGIHPVQVIPRPLERSFDAGLGYRADWQLEGTSPTLHGPYAEVGLYPLRLPLGKRTRLRWGGYASADGFIATGKVPGYGATLGTLLEISGTTAGTFSDEGSDGFVLGAVHGQWGVGAFANTSVREVDDEFSQGIVTGMSLRLSFTVGVVCCAVPDFGSNDSQEVRSSSGPSKKKASRSMRREHRVARPRKR